MPSRVSHSSGLARSYSRCPLIYTLTKLGQRDNLKLCFDAGDASSYDGSSQTWLDTSGNGYDFFRGTTSGAAANDPTFNGSAGGLSVNDYFSFDGADVFQYDSANETWMQNLHKDNAIFAGLVWVYLGSVVNRLGLFGTLGGDNTGTGVTFRILAGGTLQIATKNGASNVMGNGYGGITAGLWKCFHFGLDEGANTGWIGDDENVTSLDGLSIWVSRECRDSAAER
jgi:hypothetical protein